MTQTKLFARIAGAAALALLAGSPFAHAEGELPNAVELARWQAALTQIRTMAPEWAVQGAEAFKTSSDAGVPVVYLDVRKPEEWEKGVIEGATQVSLTDLPTAEGLAKLPEDRTSIIAVYCKSGHRSALAIPLLHLLGYSNAISMKGGYEAWVEAGYPVTGTDGG